MTWVLPVVLGLPLFGVLVLLLVPKEEEGVCRGVAFTFSLCTFLVSLLVWTEFDTSKDAFQLVFDKVWIASLGVHFKVGVDGISLWLVLLTTFLVPIVLLSATAAIGKKVKEFVISFLILELGMLGAFVALDLFLFYVMWEVMLIPMYFIIGVWGGDRRVYASIKFVLYTMVGSLLMLVAIFYLYTTYEGLAGTATFDYQTLLGLQLPAKAQLWCFLAFGLAFAIKVPLFPLHTWLPDAHVEAPTAGSVILAGVLLKFGVFGMVRWAIPLFPNAAQELTWLMVTLAVVGIVYGAMVAFAQEDVKKLVAYSSVSHLGFCVLGLFALNDKGIQGSIYTMLSHGLTTSGLFLAIGVLYERRHTRKLAEFGGLWARMPVFAGMFLIVMLGSVGLPGLSGFVGEFLCLLGAFDAGAQIPYAWSFAAVATLGVILGAIYLLWMFQKVMFGPITNERNQNLPDLSARETAVFLPLVVMIFVMGIFPRPFLNAMAPSVARTISFVQAKARVVVAQPTLLEKPAPPPGAAPTPATTIPAVPPGGGH